MLNYLHRGGYFHFVCFSVALCGSCSVVYCNWSCLWVCLCVCGSVTMINRNCVYWSSPNNSLFFTRQHDWSTASINRTTWHRCFTGCQYLLRVIFKLCAVCIVSALNTSRRTPGSCPIFILASDCLRPSVPTLWFLPHAVFTWRPRIPGRRSLSMECTTA